MSAVAVPIAFGKSFINIKNSKGPSTDPCGTPVDKSNVFEECPSIQTYCRLSAKYRKHTIRASSVESLAESINTAEVTIFLSELDNS
jgi:hypothetical protein